MRALLAASLAAAAAFGASCAEATHAPPALPVSVRHPSYPLAAALPAGWVAEASRNEIYPADVWVLKPAGAPLSEPNVYLLVGWLPRGGRQSAFFPGGRMPDARTGTMVVGGREISCLIERHQWLADFDVGALALSVRAYARNPAERALVNGVLASLTIDATASPPPEAGEKRRALDLATRYARDRGWTGVHVVTTGPGPRPHTHLLTIFRAGGIDGVVVDVARGTVAPHP